MSSSCLNSFMFNLVVTGHFWSCRLNCITISSVSNNLSTLFISRRGDYQVIFKENKLKISVEVSVVIVNINILFFFITMILKAPDSCSPWAALGRHLKQIAHNHSPVFHVTTVHFCPILVSLGGGKRSVSERWMLCTVTPAASCSTLIVPSVTFPVSVHVCHWWWRLFCNCGAVTGHTLGGPNQSNVVPH